MPNRKRTGGDEPTPIIAKKTGRKKGEMTAFDIENAKRLKKRWEAMKPKPTQDQLLQSWERVWKKSITQSALSQYLNGTVALNIETAIRMAPLFGCAPKDILDVPELRDFPTAELVPATDNWPFVIEWSRYDCLTKKEKTQIEGAVLNLILEFEGRLSYGRELDDLQRRSGRRPA